jgi:hypothetical protein
VSSREETWPAAIPEGGQHGAIGRVEAQDPPGGDVDGHEGGDPGQLAGHRPEPGAEAQPGDQRHEEGDAGRAEGRPREAPSQREVQLHEPEHALRGIGHDRAERRTDRAPQPDEDDAGSRLDRRGDRRVDRVEGGSLHHDEGLAKPDEGVGGVRHGEHRGPKGPLPEAGAKQREKQAATGPQDAD